MDVSVITENGTHLLVRQADRYAVIERRAGEFYNCHDDARAGVKDLSEIGKVLDPNDWTDRATAQSAFDEVVDRGKNLAERLW